MRYEIICKDRLSLLEDAVEQYLREGWKCQGGIFGISVDGSFTYYQAMVRGV